MPRKVFRRRRYRRRTYRRKGVSAKGVKRICKKTINAQKQIKSIYQFYGPAPVSNSAFLGSLVFVPPQGVGAYSNEETSPGDAERVGNTFYIKSIVANFEFNIGNIANEYAMVRLVIFQWMDDTSTEVPNYGDVFENKNLGTADPLYLAPINYQQRRAGKIRIIKDMRINLVANGSNAIVHRNIKITRLKYRRLQTTTNGDQGWNGNIIKGKIFFFVVSQTSLLENPPAFSYTWRMNFTD